VWAGTMYRLPSLRPTDPGEMERPLRQHVAFLESGVAPRVIQNADEKQTMLSMVAAGIGAAIAPRWWSSIAPAGAAVRELALDGLPGAHRLPLYAVWPKDIRDATRDRVIEVLKGELARYARHA